MAESDDKLFGSSVSANLGRAEVERYMRLERDLNEARDDLLTQIGSALETLLFVEGRSSASLNDARWTFHKIRRALGRTK